MLLDRILRPQFDANIFATEVFDPVSETGVMYFELCDRQNDNAMIASYASKKLLYLNEGSWNCAASGSTKHMSSLKLENVADYHKRYYNPGKDISTFGLFHLLKMFVLFFRKYGSNLNWPIWRH